MNSTDGHRTSRRAARRSRFLLVAWLSFLWVPAAAFGLRILLLPFQGWMLAALVYTWILPFLFLNLVAVLEAFVAGAGAAPDRDRPAPDQDRPDPDHPDRDRPERGVRIIRSALWAWWLLAASPVLFAPDFLMDEEIAHNPLLKPILAMFADGPGAEAGMMVAAVLAGAAGVAWLVLLVLCVVRISRMRPPPEHPEGPGEPGRPPSASSRRPV